MWEFATFDFVAIDLYRSLRLQVLIYEIMDDRPGSNEQRLEQGPYYKWQSLMFDDVFLICCCCFETGTLWYGLMSCIVSHVCPGVVLFPSSLPCSWKPVGSVSAWPIRAYMEDTEEGPSLSSRPLWVIYKVQGLDQSTWSWKPADTYPLPLSIHIWDKLWDSVFQRVWTNMN